MYKTWFPTKTIEWFAARLGIDSGLIYKILRSSEPFYQTRIVQRNGKKRKLYVPNDDLKYVQKRINHSILTWFPKHENVFGFSGGSIVDAINPHLENKMVWTCDIKNAFPSMFKERIANALKPHFSKSAYRLLVILTLTPSGTLPQGAPTSPKIFDLCMARLDREFAQLTENKKGKYSRYADNIFFSAPGHCLQEIEKEVIDHFHMAELTFHKIRVKDLKSPRGARMLGLNVIQQEIHNTRRFKKAVRLSIYHINKLLELGKTDTPDFEKAWQKLRGQMNFARIDTLPPKLLEDYQSLEVRLS